jgi:hypothetical protein
MKKKIVAIGLALAFGAACNKPKEDDCRKAIENIRRLQGTDRLSGGGGGGDIEAAVRQCRGTSTKETVACVIGAQTLDQLKACHIEIEAPAGPGSAAWPAGGPAPASGSASGSAPASGK